MEIEPDSILNAAVLMINFKILIGIMQFKFNIFKGAHLNMRREITKAVYYKRNQRFLGEKLF